MPVKKTGGRIKIQKTNSTFQTPKPNSEISKSPNPKIQIPIPTPYRAVYNFITWNCFLCLAMYRSISPVLFFLALLFLLPGTVNSQGSTEEAAIGRAVQLSNSRPDSAFLLLRAIHTRALDNKNNRLAGISAQQMGIICYHLGHYSPAMDYHLQAAVLFRAGGLDELLAFNLNDLGNLYYYNKQLTAARSQFDQALAIFRRYRNNTGLAATYGRIGHLYEKQQQYDSAFYYQRAALEQYRHQANTEGLAAIYENTGSIYEDLARYDSAYYYYNKALAQYQQEKATLPMIEVLNNLGDILRKTGQYTAAIGKTREAIALALQMNELYQLSSAYKDLAQEWHFLHRDDSAYWYQDLSRKATLRIYSKENNQQIAFLEVLNQVSKKNSEIEKLKINHRNAVVLTGTALVAGCLLVALCIVIISRQRLKIKNERLLHEQNQHMYASRNELMEIALKNKQLQEDALRLDLEMRAKELSTHTLHLIRKNQLLEELRCRLEQLVKDEKRDQKKQLAQLVQQIDQGFNHDEHWDEFRHIFEQVHESFFEKVRSYCNDLTPNDLRLIALLKMNISSADMAVLLGISPDSLRVTRYRLRKKLNLQQGENLSAFIQGL